jgi:beta-N-acetylhexosaminidase
LSDITKELTLKEKILQTVIIRIKPGEFVPDKVGGTFFFGEIITDADSTSLDNARNVIKQYVDNADIPPLVTSDFENGCGSMLKGLTPFPYLMSLGAANDESIAYDYGRATAFEARSVGANWSLSPVSDLNLNLRNPLINVRGLTDDPELAVRLLKQVVKGMQDGGLGACAKHFPGDGVDWRDQHIMTTNNTLSLNEWKNLSGRVFQELINEGVMSVMTGHIAFPAYQNELTADGFRLPATLSHELTTKLLKEEMGFGGGVVTDALNMGGIAGYYHTKEQSEIESFKAGSDMMLWPTENYVKNMEEAVKNGYISMARLDDAVNRILDMKKKLGLFEQKNIFEPLTPETERFVLETQRKTAEKSITLIRDKHQVLPIGKAKKIVIVPITHHEPALDEALLLKQELENRGHSVDFRNYALFQFEQIKAEADSHDLIIYALFSRPFRPICFLDFHSTEAHKIANSNWYGQEKIVVASFGSPYFGSQYFERSDIYVNAYSMLAPSVKAFAKALCGEIEFSGYSPVKIPG